MCTLEEIRNANRNKKSLLNKPVSSVIRLTHEQYTKSRKEYEEFVKPISQMVFNWFFKITPYQKLEGMPLMLTPLICPIGILFGVLSIKITPNKLGKWSIIFNGILIALPFLYWTLGTLVFGP